MASTDIMSQSAWSCAVRCIIPTIQWVKSSIIVNTIVKSLISTLAVTVYFNTLFVKVLPIFLTFFESDPKLVLSTAWVALFQGTVPGRTACSPCPANPLCSWSTSKVMIHLICTYIGYHKYVIAVTALPKYFTAGLKCSGGGRNMMPCFIITPIYLLFPELTYSPKCNHMSSSWLLL